MNAKRHPNLPPRSLDADHPLHFHETTSFSNHPVNRSSGMSELRTLTPLPIEAKSVVSKTNEAF